MSALDYIVFALYMAGILGIGLYHFRRNQSAEDYYVGGRSVPPFALGLSIVATLGAFFWRGATANGALCSIVAGGVTVNLLPWLDGKLPAGIQRFFFGLGLWPVVYGLVISSLVFVAVSLMTKTPRTALAADAPRRDR